MTQTLRYDGPSSAARTLVLAHGAGMGMDSPFLATFAARLAELGSSGGGIRVVRFEFPYMMRRRATGRRSMPDRMPVLLAHYREVLASLAVPARALYVGGKSLGGRVASHLACDMPIAGLVCLGYPFHPPGQPQRLRTSHLARLAAPTLICQGTRDPFGSREEVAGYVLPACVEIHWLADGDHSWVPRRKSGRTAAENIEEAAAAVLAFMAASAAGRAKL